MSIASGYLPILIMIVLGLILAGAFSCIGLFLGPKLRGEVKETPFESGLLRDGTVSYTHLTLPTNREV